MLPSLVYVGMDVAKLTLDLHAASEPRSQFRQFPNHPKGHRALIRWLQGPGIGTRRGEATGGYEPPLSRPARANVIVSVVNARHVRDFARATGRLAKTDRLDAAVLAAYGTAVHPIGTVALSAAQSQLAELVTRRQQVLALRIGRTQPSSNNITHPRRGRTNPAPP